MKRNNEISFGYIESFWILDDIANKLKAVSCDSDIVEFVADRANYYIARNSFFNASSSIIGAKDVVRFSSTARDLYVNYSLVMQVLSEYNLISNEILMFIDFELKNSNQIQ